MRTGLKIFLGGLGAWIPQGILVRITGRDLILPYYHAVSDHPMPHVSQIYPVRTEKGFRKDLDFLLKHYEPVGLEDLKQASARRTRPAMFLSFDDGLSEIYHIVSPVLTARGIPAAVFVNTGFVGNRDLFYRYKASLILDRLESIGYSPAVCELLQSRYHLERTGRKNIREFVLGISYNERSMLDEIAALLELDFNSFLKVKQPYMSIQQLRDLSEKGFLIGSHSKDHPRFSKLSPQERILQYKESMEWLDKELGLGYGIFSFPFSDDGVPSAFFDEIRSGGMPQLHASFGTAGLKTDPLPFHHQRILMEEGGDSGRRYLKGEYLYYMLKAPLKKNLIAR